MSAVMAPAIVAIDVIIKKAPELPRRHLHYFFSESMIDLTPLYSY